MNRIVYCAALLCALHFQTTELFASAAGGGVAGGVSAGKYSGSAAEAASPVAPCYRPEFINHFAVLPLDETKARIESAMHSILDHLDVKYVNERGDIVDQGFFQTLNAKVKALAPGAKIYISGGMVRSLLGYIYKKLHNGYERLLRDAAGKAITKDDHEKMVRDVFRRITLSVSRDEKFDFETGEFPEDAKTITTLKALGINSDYDVLIDLPTEIEAKKDLIVRAITDFINSAESKFGLRENRSEVKKSVVPVGDVKIYNEQYGVAGKRSAVQQGGSHLDWLAFPLDRGPEGIRHPDGENDILDLFIRGELIYTSPKPGVTLSDPDKQTIRGLRAFVEVPFLKLSSESQEIMMGELRALLEKHYISPNAK